MLYCDTAVVTVKAGSSRRFTKSVLNLKLKLKKTVVYYKAGGDVFFEGCALLTNLNHLYTHYNTFSAGMATSRKKGNNLLVAAPIGTYIFLEETGKILSVLNKKRPILIATTQQLRGNKYQNEPNVLKLCLRYYILAHLSFFGLYNSGHFRIYRKILSLLLGTHTTMGGSGNMPTITKCINGKFFSVCLPTCFLKDGIFYNTYYLQHNRIPKLMLFVVDVCVHSTVIIAGLLGACLDALKCSENITFVGRKVLAVLFTYKNKDKKFLLEKKIKNVISVLGYDLFFLKMVSETVGCYKDICRKCLLLLLKKYNVFL